MFITSFLACVVVSFGLWPFLGQNFFPEVDFGQILMHVRAQPGTRIEESARLFEFIEQTVRASSPRSARQYRRQYRIAVFRHQYGLSEYWYDRAEDGDALISLKEDHAPTAEYVKRLRTILPQKFPGSTFSFLPADIVSQISISVCPRPLTCRLLAAIKRRIMRMRPTC